MLDWLGNLLLLLCLAVFLLVAVGPHVFGYRTATMLTGSMEPGIMPGDVVVTTPEPASEVKVGDVISYHIPIEDRRVETHRVVKVIHRDNGTIAIRTKGDNNEQRRPVDRDASRATPSGRSRPLCRSSARLIRFLRTDAVQHGIFWVAFGGLLLARPQPHLGQGRQHRRDNDAKPTTKPQGTGDFVMSVLDRAPVVFDARAVRSLTGHADDRAFARVFVGRYRQLLPLRVRRIARAVQTATSTTRWTPSSA